MAENQVDVRYGVDRYAVLTKLCLATNDLATMLFEDAASARQYCNARWKTPMSEWTLSAGKWSYWLGETQVLYIEAKQMVVEF